MTWADFGGFVLGGVYVVLVSASMAGVVLYLLREEPAMAAIYLALLLLLLWPAIAAIRRKPAPKPDPPAVVGLRPRPPGGWP